MMADPQALNYKPMQGILWSCVMRDDLILAEAGEDVTDEEIVTQTAKELLKKKNTAGWEFHKVWRSNVRGIKFHVYEKDPMTEKKIVWKFCCVHDQSVQKDQAQSFIEKIVGITEVQRQEDYNWRYGELLAAQETFAPTLMQRMEEVAYMGRMAMVNEQVDSVKEVMAQNIEMMLENTEKAEDLEREATKLEEMSKAFQKRTKQVKRFQMWQNAKYGIIRGTLVTGVVVAVTVPPLIALI